MTVDHSNLISPELLLSEHASGVGESASSRRPRVLIWTSRATCPELNFDFEIDTYWTTYKKHQNAAAEDETLH